MSDASSAPIPVELAQDTVEGLFRRSTAPAQGMLWFTLSIAAAALAALPVVKIKLAVRAPGIVRPVSERVEIHAPVAGRIRQVWTHDNQSVARDQILVELEAPETSERLAHLRQRIAEIQAVTEDLRRIIGGPSDAFPAWFRPDADPEPFPVTWQTETVRRDAAEWMARLHANVIDHRKAVVEFERYDSLARRGIASLSDRDRAKYESDRLIAEAEFLCRQAMAHWQAQLHENEANQADLVSQAKQLEAEISRCSLRAPSAGILVGFNGWNTGAYVAAGQLLGAVSPEGNLRIESYVSSRDAGLVKAGQSVRLAVDALPYTRWGVLDGTVESVSGDAVTGPGTAIPVFKVCIHPHSDVLQLASGPRARLLKGYTVQVRFLVAECSLWDALSDKFSAQWDPRWAATSGREGSRPDSDIPSER
ncbi:MAG TPA: HlyD family efflux transporter periplasmic adaptor subunit [Candidatus Didemnitutus sp.]|nr:HlyD family efflux transporter periplasmic adaptor subunit [Candidatus Didemnitutus sp.]